MGHHNQKKNKYARQDDNGSSMHDCGKSCNCNICNASSDGAEGSDIDSGGDGEGDGISGTRKHAGSGHITSPENDDVDKQHGSNPANSSAPGYDFNHKPRFDEVDGDTQPTSLPSLLSNDERSGLINVAIRLQTYRNWPKPHIVTAEELSRCGFFYLGDRDRVRCAYCNLILKDWQLGDDPATEHKKFSQNCKFQQYMTQESLHTANVGEASLGISFERPKYPEYAVENNRLKTFTDWTLSKNLSKENVAKAGFFFFGQPDRVMCFFCGMKLHNWLQEDEPWFEHARHSPTCTFVVQCKGEDYVTRVREAAEKGLRGLPFMSKIPQTLPTLTLERQPIMQASENKKNVNVEQFMNTPPVRSLLEIMMVPEEMVTKALTRSLEKSDTCPDAATLMDFVCQIEDEENKTKDIQESYENQDVFEQTSSPADMGALQGGACGTLADETVSRHTYQSLFPTISSEIPNRLTTPTGGLLSSQQVPLPNVSFKQEDELPPDATNGSEELCDITENHRPKSVLNREVQGYKTNGDDDSEDIYGEGLTEKEIQDLKRQEEEELSKLKSENEQLQQERRCKICLDEVASILFLPCGHLVCCTACSPALRLCPICRKMVQGTVKTFRV